jgi:hypothetical protein
MPADYCYRRNEIRNNRRQDSRARRSINDARRQERVARLEIARYENARADAAQHQNNEMRNNAAIQEALTPSTTHTFSDFIFDYEDRLSAIITLDFEVDLHVPHFHYYQESRPLTDTDIDEYTESFTFPEFKQGFCAIDQEEIRHGDSCRRIIQVPGTKQTKRQSAGALLRCTPAIPSHVAYHSVVTCNNTRGACSAATSSTPAASHAGCASGLPARSAKARSRPLPSVIRRPTALRPGRVRS